MDGLTKIEVPLTDLACAHCREAPVAERGVVRTLFQTAAVTVETDEGLEPLTVHVDVRRIMWRRQQPGRYTAAATVAVLCPCCRNPREMQYHLDAPLVLLCDMGKCRTCKGPLELEDEEIEYQDACDGNWMVEIRANMVCRGCMLAEPKVERVPVPRWEQFRAAGEVSVRLTERAEAQANSTLLSRMRAFKGQLGNIVEDLDSLQALLSVDVPSSLNKIRFITEKILHRLCIEHDVTWGQGEPTLERMIGPALSAGVIPKTIGIHVRTIQSNASPGSHYQEIALSHSHVEIA